MSVTQSFTDWALAQGLGLNGIHMQEIPGKGFGIIAARKIEKGEVILTVPKSAFRTAQRISERVKQLIEIVSVNGLLAAEFALGTSMINSSWLAVLPTAQDFLESMPLFWPQSLQVLLPPASALLLRQQKVKIAEDWNVITKAFPAISYDHYVYSWLLVSTRTFYYTTPHIKARRTLKPDDCLALVPFADFFNHADDGCELIFAPSKYKFRAGRTLEEGEEIVTSYGGHSNDFLLIEYGFTLGNNKWDKIPLDDAVLTMFSEEQKQELRKGDLYGGFIVDKNGACHRTHVALALLHMSLDTWYSYSLRANSSTHKDRLQTAIDKSLHQILKQSLDDIDEKIKQVSMIEGGLHSPKDKLTGRWEQMRYLVANAIKSIGH